MRVKLNSEDGFKCQDDELSEAQTPGAAEAVSQNSHSLMQLRVHDVICAALEQRLPRAREIQAWEPDKLKARHIAMLTDHSSGMTPKEIALKYKMHPTYVNVVLTHPDSVIVLGALAALKADKATDIGVRLQGYANEMLTGKMEIFRTTSDLRLKDRIASDILDRAGYGSRQQIDINATNRWIMPAAAAAEVSQALDESMKVAEVDYRQYTGRRLDEGRAALESGPAATSPVSQSVPEQPETVDNASLGASPEFSLDSSSPDLKSALEDERESRLDLRKRRTA
jgi:hypothetical protein